MKEREHKIIPFYTPFQRTRITQLFQSIVDHETEKNHLENRNGKPYVREYQNQNDDRIRQIVDRQFLFGWWLVIKSMAEDLEKMGLEDLVDEIAQKAKDKRPDVPDVFRREM